MNEVIEALKAYIEKTEAREAEQQAQLAALVAQLAEKENQLVTLGQKVAELEARIETLEEEGIAPQPLATTDEEEEPEVEVELIMAEEEEIPAAPETPEIPETPAEPEPEPAPEPEPQAPEPEVEPAKPEPTPAAPAAAKFGTPVDDIRKAISLGDRFLFQRELFSQNGELMQKTLDAINGCKSFEEAVAYIDSKFGWDKESSTYQLFLTPIHRRFA